MVVVRIVGSKVECSWPEAWVPEEKTVLEQAGFKLVKLTTRRGWGYVGPESALPEQFKALLPVIAQKKTVVQAFVEKKERAAAAVANASVTDWGPPVPGYQWLGNKVAEDSPYISDGNVLFRKDVLIPEMLALTKAEVKVSAAQIERLVQKAGDDCLLPATEFKLVTVEGEGQYAVLVAERQSAVCNAAKVSFALQIVAVPHIGSKNFVAFKDSAGDIVALVIAAAPCEWAIALEAYGAQKGE